MTHYEAIPVEHLKAMRTEMRQWPWAMLFIAVSTMFIGTWFGIVIADGRTVQACGEKQSVTYHSWIYEHDMTIACEVKK